MSDDLVNIHIEQEGGKFTLVAKGQGQHIRSAPFDSEAEAMAAFRRLVDDGGAEVVSEEYHGVRIDHE